MDHIKYTQDIIQKHPSLLYYRNYDGETPAFIAAREGCLDILEIMINHFKAKGDDIESLVTRSSDHDTALHVAVQNHHAGVVFLLIKEARGLANRVNDFEESPIYLAAEKRYHVILKLMLDKCNGICFKGPNGKTALHAASISGSEECAHYLLSANRDLLHIQDTHGRTPFYYAVTYGHLSVTINFLDKNFTLGYQIMETTTAIHIAASRGHWQTIQVLISKCPRCWDHVNSNGSNILHVAVENKRRKVIEFVFGCKSLTSLINQKDGNGNTPIHLLVASDLEMIEIMQDFRIKLSIMNNDKRTPLDMASSDEKRDRLFQAIVAGRGEIGRNTASPESSEILNKNDSDENVLEGLHRLADGVALVAALIATATFAAAFTVPGGLDGNQGTPILIRRSAFEAFFVANALAFSCSCAVLFGYIRVQINADRYDDEEEEKRDGNFNVIGHLYLLTGIAMIAMVIAFITASYVILKPSFGFAVTVCTLSLLIIVSMSVVPRKHLRLSRNIIVHMLEPRLSKSRS